MYIVVVITLLFAFVVGFSRGQNNSTSTFTFLETADSTKNDTLNCDDIIGSVYKECGSLCPPTCINPNPQCKQVCVRGCFCPDSFLLYKTFSGFEVCIPANKCHIRKCPANEQWHTCPPCEGTCNDPHPVCDKMCVNRGQCVCKPNHVRDFTNHCIPIEHCPICPPNMQLYPCYSCNPTCANPKPNCTTTCAREIGGICGCKTGYVLYDDDATVCIRKEQCPKCPPNMNLYPCPYCNPTCGNPFPAGCLQICKEGQGICGCKSGFVVSRERATSNQCIPLNQCPRCPANQKYYDCVCNSTCSKTNVCRIDCVKPGCGCKPEYVVSDITGDCIPRRHCP